MASTTKQTNSTFNFENYNELMKGANSGLKLYLAEQMLTEVLSIMARYRSPLLEDITQLVDGLEELRDNNKKYLASRQAKTDEYKRVVVDDNRGADDTKLQPKNHTESGDYAKE